MIIKRALLKKGTQLDVIRDLETPTEKDTQDLLAIHENYQHMSFTKLQEMAKQGVITKK